MTNSDPVTTIDLLMLGGLLVAVSLVSAAESWLAAQRRRAAQMRFPPAHEPVRRPWAGKWRLIRNEQCECTAWVSPAGRVAANMPCRKCREWVLANATCLASQDDPRRN